MRPNPWFVVPVALAALAGGAVGFFVTDASCAPDSCGAAAAAVAVGVALAAAAGVGVVVVLAVRSLAEWREQQDMDPGGPAAERAPDPGPPTC